MTQSAIFIGFDPRPHEAEAFAVTRHSILRRLSTSIPVHGLVLRELQETGLYRRPVDHIGGKLFDAISGAAMSTEFAISRFLVPHIARRGWALFCDGDMLARCDLSVLFEQFADPQYAVMVVKHDHRPTSLTKMDGQRQTAYERKNWSSFMLFNCDHPANRELTLDRINTARGLWLHQFQWLPDELIGELDVSWNWLVGHSDGSVVPRVVHFTDGTPSMEGYRDVPFAGEWRSELERWAG